MTKHPHLAHPPAFSHHPPCTRGREQARATKRSHLARPRPLSRRPCSGSEQARAAKLSHVAHHQSAYFTRGSEQARATEHYHLHTHLHHTSSTHSQPRASSRQKALSFCRKPPSLMTAKLYEERYVYQRRTYISENRAWRASSPCNHIVHASGRARASSSAQ